MTVPSTGSAARFKSIRTANLKRLIEALRGVEMNRTQAAELLGTSLQGASKYFCDLAKHGVTEYTLGHRAAFAAGIKSTHRLTKDTKAIALFLEGLDAPKSSIKRTAATKRDPLALPAGFFAPKPATGARLAMPVIPPKPQGFPVPSEYRFELGAQA